MCGEWFVFDDYCFWCVGWVWCIDYVGGWMWVYGYGVVIECVILCDVWCVGGCVECVFEWCVECCVVGGVDDVVL